MTDARRPEEHPELHEQTDVSSRPIVTFVVVFLVLMVAFHILLYWLFGRFESAVRATDKTDSALTVERDIPDPKLQGIDGFHGNTPHRDLVELETRQRTILESYESGEEEGHYRIPIERAMELLIREEGESAEEASPESGDGRARIRSEDHEQGK